MREIGSGTGPNIAAQTLLKKGDITNITVSIYKLSTGYLALCLVPGASHFILVRPVRKTP